MTRDWFGAFLRVWMVGTIVWMIAGFTLMPEAFRRPLFADHHELTVASVYDPFDVDSEIAWKLAVILILPVVIVLVALVIAAAQERRHRRDPGAGLS